MKALVTGAAGFVGPHLVDHLRREGDEVVAIDLANGPDLLDGAGWAETLAGTRPEVVFHLAGWSDVGASWRDPRTTFEVNVIGTLSVLEGARAAGVERVVVVSSADVYGPVGPDDSPITEEHPLRPPSPYGASKQAAEAVAAQYHRGHGLDVVIVRPFNHIGPGQSPRFAAPAFADQIAAAEAGVDRAAEHGLPPVLRHGDLSSQRDLTDVRDVVRAYRLVATAGRAGEVYNVCSGRSTSMQAMLDTLLSMSTVTLTTEVDPDRLRPVEVPVMLGSPARLEEATGWRPTIGLSTSLADVLDDARRRQGATLHTGDRRVG